MGQDCSEQQELGFCVLGLWGNGWLGTDGRTVTALLGAFPLLFCPVCLYCKVDSGASISDRIPHSQKFRRRVQESTKVLRELEISLRTNHIG